MAKKAEMKTEKAAHVRRIPHNVESEQCLLGCILLDGELAGELCAVLTSEDFYVPSHRIVIEAMQEVSRTKVMDIAALVDVLDRQGNLAAVGGIDYLTALNNIVPSAANYKIYFDIVKRDSSMRKLINSCSEIVNLAYTSDDSAQTLARAEKEIFDISTANASGTLVSIKETVGEVLARIDAINKDPNAFHGIMTGYYDLDRLTNGFQGGDLIIIAARPGVGKSALAMNIVEHAAMKGGYSCAVFSLEMPRAQITQRMLCSIGSVSLGKTKSGKLDKSDFQRLWRASDSLSHCKIFIDDSSMVTPEQILSKCRRLKSRNGLDLVVVDYIQLMNSAKNLENRQQQISDITRNLKIMAKELNVPILALSQLSRLIERRDDKKPQLSDLRESGSIEQDADMVIFISKDETEGENTEKQGITLHIAKHRNGEIGEVSLDWIGDFVRFFNVDSYRKALTEQYNANKKQKPETAKGKAKDIKETISEVIGDIPLPSDPPPDEE